MQAANDKSSNQQSFFYVVWPESEEALPGAAESVQVTIPSPSQTSLSTELDSDTVQMDLVPGLQDPVNSREQPLAQRPPESASPLIQRPETPRATSSPLTLDPLKFVSSQQSQLKIYRPVPASTSLQQVMDTSAPTQHNMAESSGILLNTLPNKDSSAEDLVRVSSPVKLQTQSSSLATVTSTPQAQANAETDPENFRKIGILAEQASANIQRIIQVANKHQQVAKPVSSKEQGRSADSVSSPAAKRFCLWDTRNCMECDVKQAEIQILRKSIQHLQEYILMLNQRTQMLLSAPVVPTASTEPSRAQHAGAKQSERARVPSNPTPAQHPENSYLRSELRNRKVVDSRGASTHTVKTHTSMDPSQPGTSKSELTELVTGSGVYILTQSLTEARKDARSGTQLARKLMDIFWDKDTLARSTLTPKSKFQYQQLEPKIIKAIEAYCLQYDEAVHSRDIHATMTDKCCQARSRNRTLQSDAEVKKQAQYPMH